MTNPLQNFWIGDTNLATWISTLAPAPGNYASVSNAAMNALSRNEAEAGYTEWRPYEEPGHPAGYSVVSVTYDSNRGWTVIVLFDGEENPTTYDRLGDPADAVYITFSDHYNSIVRTKLRPTTASEVGAYSTNETMYVDWIGDIGCIYGDYMPSGVWDFGDGCIRIASWYQLNLHMTAGRQADGIEIFDTADPTIKTVIPINGSDVATIADIPDVPASVSNIVTAAYINNRVNVTPLAGRTYDFATNIGLYTAVRDLIQALGGSVTNFPSIPQN